MTSARVPLYFVVRLGHHNMGSAKMRATDLSRIVAPYLGDRLAPSVVTMPGRKTPLLQRLWARARPRGGIYFLPKSNCRMDDEAADLLRARSRGLCFDYVDSDLASVKAHLADVHVCSSYAQEAAIHALQAAGQFPKGPTQVVLHNADAALYGLAPRRRHGFAAIYCGNARNTRIPQPLTGRVEVLQATKPWLMRRGLPRLLEFPMHYCIRGDDAGHGIKPFTKGVTAALCDANVLTTRDQPDAVRLLGEDYPFFAEGSADEQVIDAFQRAEAAFGGPEWHRGLAAMARAKEAVSGPTLAAQVRRLAELCGVT